MEETVSGNSTESTRWYYSEDDLQSLEYLDMPVPEKGRIHEVILRDPLSRLNVPKPVVLKVDDSVLKAIRLMKKFRLGSVLVVQNGELVGIFTEKDLLVKTTGSDAPRDLSKIELREVMTLHPQALEEDDTIAHALHLMSVGEYRHVPILRDGSPIGFVSIRGILHYITVNALGS